MKYLKANWLELILLLVVLLAAVLPLRVTLASQHTEIIVVHTGESKTLLYNPATHEEVRNEAPDGNVILTVKPKE